MRNLYGAAEDGATGYYFPPALQGKTQVGVAFNSILCSATLHFRAYFDMNRARNKIGNWVKAKVKGSSGDTASLESILN